jgi:hypothetical protein
MPERTPMPRSRSSAVPAAPLSPRPSDARRSADGSAAAHAASLVGAPAAMSSDDVLALQRTAGNRAVAAALHAAPGGVTPAPIGPAARRVAQRLGCARRSAGDQCRRGSTRSAQRSADPRARLTSRRSVQRAPTAPSVAGPRPASQPGAGDAQQAARNDVVDFLNGFQALVGSAVNDKGRSLYAIKFGPDTSAKHRKLLERVRRVLIKRLSADAAVTGAARAEWPKLAKQLRDELAAAKGAGIRADQIAHIQDQIAYIAEAYLQVKSGPSEVTDPADVKDFLDGIQALLAVTSRHDNDRTSGVVELNREALDAKVRDELKGVQFGPNLSSRRRRVLEGLRETLILARTTGSASTALARWNTLTPDLNELFDAAGEYVTGDTQEIRRRLNELSKQLIHGGAYSEAHQAALKDVDLPNPDEAYQLEALADAVEEVKQSQKLAGKAFELTAASAIDELLADPRYKGAGKAIIELALNPGKIKKALEEFREQGWIGKTGTIADVTNRVRGFAMALAKVSFMTMQRFANAAYLAALKSGALEKAFRWWKVSEWAGEKVTWLKKIEDAKIFKVKILTVATVVISAIKIVEYIRQGKWAKALEEAASTSLGLLASAAAGGLAGTAVVGGIGIIIAAEAEGLAGAAAMIRYCEKANIRDAAGEFVTTCVSEWNGGAAHFVADVKMLDAAQVVERPIIERNLNLYAKEWLRAMDDMSAQLRSDRVSKLGGQPALKKALGPEAEKILNNPASWTGNWQRMAEQIRTLFHAANELGKYVAANYPKRDAATAD